MSAKVFRTPAASRDLRDIARSIRKDRPEVARRFLRAARAAFEFLANHPDSGTACNFENPRAAGIRLWTIAGFRNYVVMFRRSDDGLEVVRVLHGARDFTSVFDQHGQ